MRRMVALTLSGGGFDVIEAEDGVDAFEKAQQQQIDLVLTDVNMPNKDGIALVRELRGLPQFKFTPMIMLTTESVGDKKAEGKAAGATGWIVKPFSPEQLLNTIRRVLA